MNDKLPPIPPGYKYGGQLKDYADTVQGMTFEFGRDTDWSEDNVWNGMKSHPKIATADWHIAVPDTADVPPEIVSKNRPVDDSVARDLERKLGIARAALQQIADQNEYLTVNIAEHALNQTAKPTQTPFKRYADELMELIKPAYYEFVSQWGMEPTDVLIPTDMWDKLHGAVKVHRPALRVNGMACHEWYAPHLAVCILAISKS